LPGPISEERKVIDEVVKEYQRAPGKYDREASDLGAILESVAAEATRMRSEHAISEADWDAACKQLMKGRPLSQPLFNSHVLEHILKARDQ
jgi:aminoglycoside N3'-acetyltransferase